MYTSMHTATLAVQFHAYAFQFKMEFYHKPRMRVVPRRPSGSIQAHTQARLPFTQPTMQLSFKFQSRNLRGLAISLQKLSAGFVTHAASSRTIGRKPAASGLAGVDSFVLFESTRYGSGPTRDNAPFDRETCACGGWRGDQRSNACRRSRSIDREPAGFANPLRGSHVHACPGIKLDIRPIIACGAPTACGLAGQ